MTPREALADACAAWCLGETRADVRRMLVDTAVACVLAGEGSVAVGELAGTTEAATWSEIDRVIADVVAELGFRTPLVGSSDAVRVGMRIGLLPLAKQVVTGTCAPTELTSLVASSWQHDDAPDLDELLRLAQRSEVLEGVIETEGETADLLVERAATNAAVVEAARQLVARLGRPSGP